MAIHERISSDLLHQMSKLKDELATLPQAVQEKHLSDDEQLSIREELLKQAEMEEESDDFDEDILGGIGSPKYIDGIEKKVEVEYLGRVGYIDISFETLQTNLTEEEYGKIVRWLEEMAYDDNPQTSANAAKEIEKYGDEVIEVVFRECRKFDLSHQQKRQQLVQLLARLTNRSLKGRRIIKGILQKATTPQHINVALMVSGAIYDKEVADEILRHAKNPDHFGISVDALLKIRAKETVKPLLQIIHDIDTEKKELLDEAIQYAHRFGEFGPFAVKDVCEALINCSKFRIRPIFTVAVRSFRDDAVPHLLEMLEKEHDDLKIDRISKALGGLGSPYVTNMLMEAYDKFPGKRVHLIDGLSHTKDPQVLPLLLRELQQTESWKLRQKCLLAMAFLGNQEHIPLLRQYTSYKKDKIYLYALFALVCLHDDAAFDQYMKLLVHGDQEEQYELEKLTAKMPMNALVKISRGLSAYNDSELLSIITALQRPNVLPRELANTLKEILSRTTNATLRLEIYRLIGLHVNTKKEILPQHILYNARQNEENPRVRRELEQIMKNMKQEKGHVAVSREIGGLFE